MVEDKRVLLVEADENLGQFVEQQAETSLGGEETNVSVTEVDPNTIPDNLLD